MDLLPFLGAVIAVIQILSSLAQSIANLKKTLNAVEELVSLKPELRCTQHKLELLEQISKHPELSLDSARMLAEDLRRVREEAQHLQAYLQQLEQDEGHLKRFMLKRKISRNLQPHLGRFRAAMENLMQAVEVITFWSRYVSTSLACHTFRSEN
jgi:DNA repair ATPase RecN